MIDQHTKNEYREWATSIKGLVPFFQPEWLDLTCGVFGWDVRLVKDNTGSIRVAFPFQRFRKWGISFHLPPPMAPCNGPWIASLPNTKYAEAQARHWRVIGDLFAHLPQHGLSIYHWDALAGDALPAIWSGFSIQTRYTFLLATDQTSKEDLWSGLRDKVRNHIRQAETNHRVNIKPSVEALINCFVSTFDRKKMPFAGSVDSLRALLQTGDARGWFQSWLCENEKGEPVAGLTLLIGPDRAWIMFQGTRGGEGGRGALSLLVWSAIQYCQERSLLLDFEGSVLEPVARSAANFGAHPVPYCRIYKDNMWYMLWKGIKGNNSY